MKAEIIAIGTELLLGDIINSNAAWISKALAGLGVDVYHHSSVGDNPQRIQAVIRHALGRADLLIFTGGLGPTEDDLTHQTLADCFDVAMINDPQTEAIIRDIFQKRHIAMSPSNLKQALKPEGSITMANPIGTAPAIAWDISQYVNKPAYILTYPGVPKELHAIWPQGRAFIRQWQQALGEQPSILSTVSLQFFGIAESLIAEKLSDLMQSDNPTVASYVGKSQVRIRIAAKAQTEAEGAALIDPVRQEILKRCGEYYIGEDGAAVKGSGVSLESIVAELLTTQNLTVGVAESCTGGLVSSALTDIAGSSRYIKLNLITYCNQQKQALLGVSSEALETYGAVSEQVAEQMAAGIKRLSGCDIGLSVTGIAGPGGGTDEKPVGLVFISLCGKDGATQSHTVRVNSRNERTEIKRWFSMHALNILRQHLIALQSE